MPWVSLPFGYLPRVSWGLGMGKSIRKRVKSSWRLGKQQWVPHRWIYCNESYTGTGHHKSSALIAINRSRLSWLARSVTTISRGLRSRQDWTEDRDQDTFASLLQQPRPLPLWTLFCIWKSCGSLLQRIFRDLVIFLRQSAALVTSLARALPLPHSLSLPLSPSATSTVRFVRHFVSLSVWPSCLVVWRAQEVCGSLNLFNRCLVKSC